MTEITHARKVHLDRQPESLRVVGLAWMRLARCARFDDDYADTLFHPTPSGTVPQSERRAREAARTCLLCPVRTQCLAHALHLEAIQYMLTGIWAGTTQGEREATKHASREDRLQALDAVARSKAAQSLAPWEAVA